MHQITIKSQKYHSLDGTVSHDQSEFSNNFDQSNQHGNGVRGSKIDRYHYGFYQHQPKYDLEGLQQSEYKDNEAKLEDLNGSGSNYYTYHQHAYKNYQTNGQYPYTNKNWNTINSVQKIHSGPSDTNSIKPLNYNKNHEDVLETNYQLSYPGNSGIK